MQIIEFETQFNNGVLQIPLRYKAFKNAKVKVIVMPETKKSELTSNFYALQQVLDDVGTKTLFRSIQNPVEWQKKLRDEWE